MTRLSGLLGAVAGLFGVLRTGKHAGGHIASQDDIRRARRRKARTRREFGSENPIGWPHFEQYGVRRQPKRPYDRSYDDGIAALGRAKAKRARKAQRNIHEAVAQAHGRLVARAALR